MQCSACQANNPDFNRFCELCGVGLSQLCPACGHTCAARVKFCGECGTALTVKAVPAVPAALVSEAAWAELKQATMLFADIVSSTEKIAGLDPEQARAHLRPAVLQMCGAIESFGGTVVRTLGDGVMAVFGIPRALEGHGRLACEAALAMQAAFKDHPHGLRIRVGLHSGLVASDPEDHDVNIGGGVYGHAVHLASRVVGLAEPGGVCLTAACLAPLQKQCTARSIGFQQLKGIPDATEIFVLEGLSNAAAQPHNHEALLSTFRGRTHELAGLQQALAQAKAGKGAVLGVCGVAGTGKSRLSHEFIKSCNQQGMPVVEVRSQPYGYATPLLPLLALLRTWVFQIAPCHSAEHARQQITDQLTQLGSVLTDDYALLCDFLSVADTEASPCTLEPKARRTRLLTLLKMLFRQAGSLPVAIIFEDLHWLDDASEVFLSALIEGLADSHIVLVLNYRPSYQVHWLLLTHFQQINLVELSTEDTAALVHELLAPHPQLREAASVVVGRSAGNPFFAEELVHTLVESAELTAKNGLASVLQALPATVQAVIGERIDRLFATQKKLLHICAVIGREIPLPVLRQVAVYLASHLETGLDGLCEADLLQMLRAFTDSRRYAFRHPLIQEVAYSSQLKTRRAEVHASVAVAMVNFYRHQQDEYAALIAHHFEVAEQPVEAARYAARAAQWMGAANSTQAMAHWRKARALLQDQPRATQTDQLRVKIGGGLVYLGWREGMKPKEVQEVVAETVALATEMDNRLVQLLYLAEGRILQGTGGGADDYVGKLQTAIGLGAGNADVGRLAVMSSALSHAYSWSGLLNEGLIANDVALNGVRHIDPRDTEFFGFDIYQWVLMVRARILVRMGRLDEMRLCMRTLLGVLQPDHDSVIRQVSYMLEVELGIALEDMGIIHEAGAKVEHIAATHGSPYTKIVNSWVQGQVKRARHHHGAAARDFCDALAVIRSTGVGHDLEVEALAGLAECCAGGGDHEQALLYAKDAVALSHQRHNRVAECRALTVCGGSLVRSRGVSVVAEAKQFLEQATQLIAVTGAKLYEPALMRELAYCAQLAADGSA